MGPHSQKLPDAEQGVSSGLLQPPATWCSPFPWGHLCDTSGAGGPGVSLCEPGRGGAEAGIQGKRQSYSHGVVKGQRDAIKGFAWMWPWLGAEPLVQNRGSMVIFYSKGADVEDRNARSPGTYLPTTSASQGSHAPQSKASTPAGRALRPPPHALPIPRPPGRALHPPPRSPHPGADITLV